MKMEKNNKIFVNSILFHKNNNKNVCGGAWKNSLLGKGLPLNSNQFSYPEYIFKTQYVAYKFANLVYLVRSGKRNPVISAKMMDGA